MVEEANNPLENNIFHNRYHPENGHVVLEAANGLKFSVEPVLLRLGSGFFRTMFEMPRSANEPLDTPIVMAEQGFVVETMLDIINPSYSWTSEQASAQLMTPKQLGLVAEAAEKYEMPKVMTFVRTRAQEVLQDHPVSYYCLTYKHGWTSEQDIVRDNCLNLDLTSEEYKDELLSLPGLELLRLFKTQHLRERLLENRLEELRDNILDNLALIDAEELADYQYHFENISRCIQQKARDWPTSREALSEVVFGKHSSQFDRFHDFLTSKTSFSQTMTFYGRDQMINSFLSTVDFLPAT